MELLAIFTAFLASLSGVVAVGCKQRFAYSPKELASGEPIALAYVWVCISTVVSALHTMALIDAAARDSGPTGVGLFAASTSCSLLFAMAHVVVGKWADKRNGVAPSELADKPA